MSKLSKVQERGLDIVREAAAKSDPVVTEDQPRGEGEWVVSGHVIRTPTLWALERRRLVVRHRVPHGDRVRYVWRAVEPRKAVA